MTDAALSWSGDLSLGPSGDIATVTGVAESQGRVERRLFTNGGAYIFHLDYGGGFPALVGTNVTAEQVQAIATAQMALEPSVLQSAPIRVTTTADATGNVTATISYATSEGVASVAGAIG